MLLLIHKSAGLQLKLNDVALKGVNDGESDKLIGWCGEEGFDLTLIEVMPLGEVGSGTRVDQYLPLSMVRADLRRAANESRESRMEDWSASGAVLAVVTSVGCDWLNATDDVISAQANADKTGGCLMKRRGEPD